MNFAPPNALPAAPPAPIYRRLHCHAVPAGPRGQCGTLLGYTKSEVQFVGLAARAPTQPDGRIWVRCSRCKTWNIFAVVEPAEGDA